MISNNWFQLPALCGDGSIPKCYHFTRSCIRTSDRLTFVFTQCGRRLFLAIVGIRTHADCIAQRRRLLCNWQNILNLNNHRTCYMYIHGLKCMSRKYTNVYRVNWYFFGENIFSRQFWFDNSFFLWHGQNKIFWKHFMPYKNIVFVEKK